MTCMPPGDDGHRRLYEVTMLVLQPLTPDAEMEERTVNAKLFTLGNAIDRGEVHLVACLLKDADFRDRTSARGVEAQAVIEDARAWLAEAEKFEAVHGPGSKVDLSHPWFIKHQPAIDAYWRAEGVERRVRRN